MKSLIEVVVMGCVVVVVPIVVVVTPGAVDDGLTAIVFDGSKKLRSGEALGSGMGRKPRKTSNMGCEAATLSSSTLAVPLNVPVATGVKLTSESGSNVRNCEPRSTRSWIVNSVSRVTFF
jgi:hypothetical protein